MTEFDITDAVCEHCGKPVVPCAGFGMSWSNLNRKEVRMMENYIYGYWHCESHGAVGAIIKGRTYHKPQDCFNKKITCYDMKPKEWKP